MLAADGSPHTAHTCNKVPFIMTSHSKKFALGKMGALADVAPTILKYMEIEIPEEMTGSSLLEEN